MATDAQLLQAFQSALAEQISAEDALKGAVAATKAAADALAIQVMPNGIEDGTPLAVSINGTVVLIRNRKSGYDVTLDSGA